MIFRGSGYPAGRSAICGNFCGTATAWCRRGRRTRERASPRVNVCLREGIGLSCNHFLFCQPRFPTKGEKNCDISLTSCASRLFHFLSRHLQPHRGQAQPLPQSFTGRLITTSTCLLTYNQTAWRKTSRL